MKWILQAICILVLSINFASCITKEDRIMYRDQVKEMFYHSYNNYMTRAFPKDEIKPLNCEAYDTWGGYSLTLIDSLDTLLVMGDHEEFRKGVNYIAKNINFDYDKNVSVFETNIRVLGGLLSAHLLAIDPTIIEFPSYNNELLDLCIDLGNRLLPAFSTPTGIPYGTVNLRHGVPPEESQITCTSGATTFSLEFGLLSKLSGNEIYQNAARNAVQGIWDRRSSKGLVGNHINIVTGDWTHMDAGIGHGIDSFYEYLLKSYIYFDDLYYLSIFSESYVSVNNQLKFGEFYVEVQMYNGQITWPLFGTLQAFWPGMQVLYGDLAEAIKTIRAFHTIWKQNGFTPEGLNLLTGRAQHGQESYPLRPELVESLWYLSRAFPYDSEFVRYGVDIIESLKFARVNCGYAAIKNIYYNNYMNRMDSFFLAETLKYLYLLFDDDNWVHKGNFIFNTEAHIFPIKAEFQKKQEAVLPLNPIEGPLECVDPKTYLSLSFLNWNNVWEKRWNECSIFLIKTSPPPPVVQQEKQEINETVLQEKKQEGLQKLQNILNKNKRNKTESVIETAVQPQSVDPVVVEEQQVEEPENEVEQMKVEQPIIISLNGQQDIQGIINSIFSNSQLIIEQDENIEDDSMTEDEEIEFEEWKENRRNSKAWRAYQEYKELQEYKEFQKWLKKRNVNK